MSIHYEVEKTIEQMREVMKTHKLPADASNAAHVVQRNREISVQLTKMFLLETNRGTEFTDLLGALTSFTAEAFCNLIVRIDDPAMQQVAYDFFISRISTGIDQFMSGKGRSFTVPVHSQSGGHA